MVAGGAFANTHDIISDYLHPWVPILHASTIMDFIFPFTH
jgi:hypothetical protein